jgi:hypothetical protein
MSVRITSGYQHLTAEQLPPVAQRRGDAVDHRAAELQLALCPRLPRAGRRHMGQRRELVAQRVHAAKQLVNLGRDLLALRDKHAPCRGFDPRVGPAVLLGAQPRFGLQLLVRSAGRTGLVEFALPLVLMLRRRIAGGCAE